MSEPQTIHDINKLRAALKDEGGRWFMNHYAVSKLLGKNPGNHLPDEGFELVHNGVTIKCDPKPPVQLGWDNKPRKSSKHRVRYYCACCKWIPLGRAHQHLPHCEAVSNTI